MRPIIETCQPRSDVLRGGLSDNHFAAQLDQVVRTPEAYPVYGSPDEFFTLTYPTQGLRDLLSRTFGRLTGARVEGAQHGVIRSETSFGGGKTHSLIAVYHLAKGARPSNLSEFIEPSLLPPECQVAAIVADTLDPANGLVTNGILTHTIWGELGAQLGPFAYHQLQRSDETRTAPGKETLASAIGEGPTVVIIDELAQCLRQLVSSGDPDVRRMASAVPVFMKNLFELAAGRPNLVIILTLATRQDAFGKETDELTALLNEAEQEDFQGTVRETESVLGRFTTGSSIVQPAADTEIAAILKRRLFENVDESAATETAEAYRSYYEDLLKKGEHLTGGAEQPGSYSDLLRHSYPFHPELVRVLDKRLGTIPSFQRTRGALKLLAEVVHGVWAGDSKPEILNVADIDYDREAVLAHLTVGLGRPDFQRVALADFVGPSSHARQVDEAQFAGGARLATRACRTVFTHSLEMVMTAGTGRADAVLGTMRLGEDPELVLEALAAVEQAAWFLDYTGQRWRFSTEPNANNIVAEAAQNVPNTKINAELEDRVRAAFPADGSVDVVYFPSGPVSVRDRATLQLVVLHHDDVAVASREAAAPPSKLVEILDRSGAAGAIRHFRNALVFLVADTDAVAGMRDRVRTDLAAQAVVADSVRMREFDPEVRRKLQGIADSAKLKARIALTRCYRHLYYPAADRANQYLHHEELPAASQGEVMRAQTRVLVEHLREVGKVRTAAVATDFLRQKAWPKSVGEVTTQQVDEAFWADPAAQMILDITLLRDAIRDGVRNGSWIYYDSTASKAWTDRDPPPTLQFGSDFFLYTTARARELGLTGRSVSVDDVERVLSSSPVISGPELWGRLEEVVGRMPGMTELSDALARAAEDGAQASAVVVSGAAEPGARALTPSDVRRASLDSLQILSPEEADRRGIVRIPVDPPLESVEASGAPGVAFQSLVDKAKDAAGIAGFTTIAITAGLGPTSTLQDVTLLAKAIGQLPKFEIVVALDLDLDFDGLKGDAIVRLEGPGARYQKVEDYIYSLAKKASAVAGTLRLDVQFSHPIVPDGAEVAQLRKVLLELAPGELRLKGILA